MKLFVHFCAFSFCNCYILGTEDSQSPREAIIIDPGGMDKRIIQRIEDNEYSLQGVLVTHGHLNHVQGITTLKRIYNTDIYGISPVIQEHKTIPIRAV